MRPSPPVVALTPPNGPALELRLHGPALIQVAFADTAAKGPVVALERRRVGAAEHVTDVVSAGEGTLHEARPGATYTYRARVDQGGAWSNDVEVTMPIPTATPDPPTSLRVASIDPYAVTISWNAAEERAVGFTIEVARDGNFELAAVVNPSARAFVHNDRVPGQVLAYRVRAFNQVGFSAFTPEVSVTTTKSAPLHTPEAPPPCTKLPPLADPAHVGMTREVLTIDRTEVLNVKPPFPPGAVISDPVPDQGPLLRRLYGEYEGCVRLFGEFEFQDIPHVVQPGIGDEGRPLLRAVAGAGEYVGAGTVTLRFARGRYQRVNEAAYCGAADPHAPYDVHTGVVLDNQDPRTWRPPFDACQRDYPHS